MMHYVLYPSAVQQAPELVREQVHDYCTKAGFDPYQVHTIRLIPKTRQQVFEVYILDSHGQKQVDPLNNEKAWLEEITRPLNERPAWLGLCKMEEILA